MSPRGGLRSALRRRAPLLRHVVIAAQRVLADARRTRWRRLRQPIISDWLAKENVRRLHLGAGATGMRGWLNTDLDPRRGGSNFVFLDVTEPFPFPDASIDLIFCEHMIEHIGYADGVGMLGECWRVLKPGGALRVSTPDLAVLAALYNGPLNEMQESYVRYIVDQSMPGCTDYAPAFVVNSAFHAWGPRFLYDEAILRGALQRAGFCDVTRHAMGESSIADFRGVESHGKQAGHYPMAEFESMVFEARR